MDEKEAASKLRSREGAAAVGLVVGCLAMVVVDCDSGGGDGVVVMVVTVVAALVVATVGPATAACLGNLGAGRKPHGQHRRRGRPS